MRFPLFFIVLYASFSTYSQDYSIKTLKTETGLPSNQVYITLEDSKGYLWAGTKNGVMRWDSKNFEYFTIKDGLPNNEIIGLFEDSRGRVWLMSFNNEIAYYLNKKIYTAKNDPRLTSVKLRTRSYMYEKDGFICFQSNEGFTKKMSVDNLQLDSRSDRFDFASFISYKGVQYGFFPESFSKDLADLIAKIGIISTLKLAIENGVVIRSPAISEFDSIAMKYLDTFLLKKYRSSDFIKQESFHLTESGNKLISTSFYLSDSLDWIHSHRPPSRRGCSIRVVS